MKPERTRKALQNKIEYYQTQIEVLRDKIADAREQLRGLENDRVRANRPLSIPREGA